jgi:hypothetical protein
MQTREALAEMRGNLIDKQTGKLAAAAAGWTARPGARCRQVAGECGPDAIDTLVTLLSRLRTVAPHRIAGCPVVAFLWYGQVGGVQPVPGAAITADGGRYTCTPCSSTVARCGATASTAATACRGR